MDLTFRLQGYKEQVVPVKKNAWPTELNITLEPASAPVTEKPDITPVAPSKKIIQVATNPPGASIQLDGQSIGQTPKEITLDNEQPHQLVLKMEGHEDVTRTLDTSTPGTLNIELPPAAAAAGFVKFGGPQRVTIISGSKALKGSPVQLEPGTYKLTFRSSKNAYIRFTKSVVVESGETVVVPAPAMGKITIKAVPSNCKISINGEFIDVAPVLNLPIQAGNHTITFSWEASDKKTSKTVSVEADQSQTVTGLEKDA
jgi:PEGA domain